VTTPTEPKVGQPIKFTWTKAGPPERLQYEQFTFGRVAKPGGVIALDSIEDTRQISPDQPPQVDKDDTDPGNYGWYIRGIISGGIELDSPIQVLNVLPPPQPSGEVMPITLWHAINYWASWHRQNNSPYINRDFGMSLTDVMASIALAEQGGSWTLNPCGQNTSPSAPRPYPTGPYQLTPGTDKRDIAGNQINYALACTAWKSTEVAAKMMFMESKPGCSYGSRICEWAVWPYGAQQYYQTTMAGRDWDGYKRNVHRVSTSRCFSGPVCDNPVVDLGIPNSVGAIPHESGGDYDIVFKIYNQPPNNTKAVFTVIALETGENYDVVPGSVLWLPDWSEQIMLSPAIPEIGLNSIYDMPIRLRPRVADNLPPIRFRVYGENVGVGSLDLSNSAMGIYEDTIHMELYAGAVPALTGQGLHADIAFDHQGPAAILTADITVTGSGLVKKATLRIPVSNDPTPRRYVATAYLGRVTDVDPRGEWQIKASVSYRGKELISKILAEAYLVS
jgi:hypothetical protein